MSNFQKKIKFQTTPNIQKISILKFSKNILKFDSIFLIGHRQKQNLDPILIVVVIA